MNWLFRPERGGFTLLRVAAGAITVSGLLLALLFATLTLLALAGIGGGPFLRISTGTLVGQAGIMMVVGLAIAAAGHLLRALALVLAERLGDVPGNRSRN